MVSRKKDIPDSNRPMILQVIPELSAGGAEQGCIDVAVGLVQAGCGSIVVSNNGNRIPELVRAGITHVNLPVHSKNPYVMWKNIGRLRRLIREHRVDVVHARSRAPAWSAWHACIGTGARFMTTCHAPYNTQNSAKKFYNSSIAKGERVIAISHYVAHYLSENFGLDGRTIRIIHRGIALEKFHPAAVTPERMIKLSRDWRLPDGVNVIMMPGRLTRWKGHHILIEAIGLLNREDIFCLIIGDDQGRTEYREEIESLIARKNLEGRVRIIPHCGDMPAAYMIANVVVSASTDPEGFGRIPAEAQAMGKPIIATDHGGARETILRGETGWLVTPGNPQDLASAITEALTLTQEQRYALAHSAMNHIAQNFSREKMVHETLGVYSELMEARETSRNLARIVKQGPEKISSPLQSQKQIVTK